MVDTLRIITAVDSLSKYHENRKLVLSQSLMRLPSKQFYAVLGSSMTL